MKTVVIAGCSSLIVTAARLLSPAEMKIVGLADTRKEAWNVYDEQGEIKADIEELPIMPPELCLQFEPDIAVIAAADASTADSLRFTLIRSGFVGDIIFLNELLDRFSVRGASLRQTAERLDALGIEGAVAEVGCYQGDLSWQLNALMPERRLHLFDTFRGPDPRDIEEENRHLPNRMALPGYYADANAKRLTARLPYPDMAEIHEGRFPDTAEAVKDEKFALAVIDAGLYQPTFSALEFFFPRMARGGLIYLFGLDDPDSPNVAEAVSDFEERYGVLLLVRLGDARGTAVAACP